MSTHSLPLFAALEPVGPHVRLMLSEPMAGTSLKARLPSEPSVETEPGEQAQVDWGSFGQVRICPASHRSIVRRRLSNRPTRFCACTSARFRPFGGVPKKLLYDNLKTVVLHHVGRAEEPVVLHARNTQPLDPHVRLGRITEQARPTLGVAARVQGVGIDDSVEGLAVPERQRLQEQHHRALVPAPCSLIPRF